MRELIAGQVLDGTLPAAANGIARDSRTVQAGALFIAGGADAAAHAG
ncbi:MAG: hypothetical protein H0W72_16090, partial [Planctomycetes bacterium]|nr:hypothetical protein [Planctomycetota bacterium]